MIAVTITASSTAPIVVRLVRENAVPAEYKAACAADGFSGACGTAVLLLGVTPGVLLAGVGDGADDLAYEWAGAVSAARLLGFAAIAIDAAGLSVAQAVAVATGAVLRATPQLQLRALVDEGAPKLTAIDIVTADAVLGPAWWVAAGTIRAVLLARDLVTEPANTLNPQTYVDRLAPLRDAGITIEVIDAARLLAMGAGALLAVGQGAASPPALVVLRWPGAGGVPVTFVGKGITFDTGGICIKPADKMWEMRADMAGSAAAVGAIYALALRRAPTAARAILALAENAVGAGSYRPSDVLKTLSGKTVEVVDTDAEGRLVLADALSFAARENPRAIIDLATLTGSMVTALGHVTAGFFSNDDGLADKLVNAGSLSGESVWRMPIDDSHRRALDSEIADLRHCVTERLAPDACQAAAFLREFVGATPWLHIDIAGVDSWDEADDLHPQGARGFGVRLLDRFIADHFDPA